MSVLLPATAERRAPARRLGVAIAAALGVATVLFRIATLGGSLGGFDDDHFVSFEYAKQVQAGERPLRDFQGISLSGVWPQLQFVTSASAQRLFGNNLGTEAWLTAGAMGAGAGLTFAAASGLASLPAAAGATILSVLLAPKLYNYPKVLVLSLAALLLIAYARRPSARRAAALGALTAAAFLYRHDLAVYAAAGALTTLAAVRPAGGVSRAGHTAVYAAITIALLTPSLIDVQRHMGLRSYFEFALENSTREAARTELSLPVFSMSPEAVEGNAVAWLYAAFMLLPGAALLVALRERRSRRWQGAALAGIAVAAIVANVFMLRSNLGARFGDVAPLAAVLGAALCMPAAAVPRPPRRLVGVLAAVVFAAVTAASVWVVGSVGRELRTAEWPNWPGGLVRRVQSVSADLARLPAAARDDPEATDAMLLAQYVNRCTQPHDRVMQLSYTPEVLPFAERLFAGGIALLVLTANTPESDAFVLSKFKTESVPIVLAAPDQLEPLSGRGDPYFPRLHAYIRERYRDVGTLRATGEDIHILAATARAPAGTFRNTGLPCFR